MKAGLVALSLSAVLAGTGIGIAPMTASAGTNGVGDSTTATSDSEATSRCRQQARCGLYYLYDYGDRQDGPFGANLEYSTLSDRQPGQLIVKMYGYEFTTQRLNAMNVWFDVNRRNSGPEYLFANLFAKDRDGHHGQWAVKIDTWGWRGHHVRCPEAQTYVNYARDVITLKVPRQCVGNPAKVRWSPTTWRITRYDDDGSFWGYVDGAPYYKRFASWWTGGGGCTCKPAEEEPDARDRPLEPGLSGMRAPVPSV